MSRISKIMNCIFCILTCTIFSQNANFDKLLKISTITGAYRYANVLPEGDLLQELKNEKNEDYQFISNLVVSAFENPDTLLSEKFLRIPNNSNLQLIYKLNALYFNSFQLSEVQQKKLVDSLNVTSITQAELIYSYYNFLFGLLGKQRVDYRSVNIDLNNCIPGDSVGQVILFLTVINKCAKEIRSKPDPQSQSLLKELENKFKMYPTFNKKPFYEMTAIPITDFQVNFYQGIGVKGYYENQLTSYFFLLMAYYNAVKNEVNENEAINSVWLKTALQLSELYPYLNESFQKTVIDLCKTVNATSNIK